MSDFQPLGKPVRPVPVPDVIEDEYEKVDAHGTILRNKRTGKLETSITPKGPQYAPYIQPEPQIITTEQWDQMFGILKKQEEDGFPVAFWGTM